MIADTALPQPSGNRDPLQALQSEILEAVARGASLQETADLLCSRAEAMAPGVVCSILAIDAEHRLRPLASPSIPSHFAEAIDGIPIGPSVGSCGTAAHLGEAVMVTDIETDPLWAPYKGLALTIGLRACWSSPIKNRDGRVVGTFAFYYRTPRGPSELEREIVRTCVHLTAIALEHDEALARINRLAFYDALTGLPNRASFHAEGNSILADGRDLDLFYIDLDDFKGVNDTLGHAVGDQLLRRAAERLLAALDEDCILARLGGDEFAIIRSRPDATDADCQDLAHRLRAQFSRPLTVEDHEVTVGLSIGIARAPRDGTQLDCLSRRADLALYAAKGEGRGTHRFFSPEMESAIKRRRDLRDDLRSAISRSGLDLAYQPILSLADSRLRGFEVLARWTHPTRGAVPPDEFIPLAEESGLVDALGEYVLREACREAANWPSRLQVAVNLSPLQLRNPGFALSVLRALAETGLRPERLELEITETALLTQDDASLTAMRELRAIGVGIALDDFGTGYSSLSHLHAYPIDRIKIDMSFVRDVTLKADSTAIVRSVIGLARDLGMKTTAEGVETPDQLRWLTAQGCDEVQGYLISPPVAAAQVATFFEAERLAIAV